MRQFVIKNDKIVEADSDESGYTTQEMLTFLKNSIRQLSASTFIEDNKIKEMRSLYEKFLTQFNNDFPEEFLWKR